jgi:flagellar protein FlbT
LPLKLDLKSGEKMVINGAVLENVGPNSKIIVHNQAMILREKEVLTDEICATPASRVYLALQCAYIFPDRQVEYLDLSETHLSDFVKACPSAESIVEKIRKYIEDKDLYKGLKTVQELIEHETRVLDSFNSDIQQLEASESSSEIRQPNSND